MPEINLHLLNKFSILPEKPLSGISMVIAMNKKPQHLSLCMIVKNEEDVLPRCLKSVSGLIQEIIIVDTGSTDSTLAVAKEFSAKTYKYTWDNNFSNARNFALMQASGDWILILDADEILGYENTDQFQPLLSDPKTEAYFIRIVSILGASYEIETSEDHVLRLFRNRPEYRFSGAIHEQVYPSVIDFVGADRIKKAPLTIYHDGYLSETIQKKNKICRNLQVTEKALTLNPQDPFLRYSLGCEYFLSGKSNQALETFQQALPLIHTGTGYRPDLVIKLGLCLFKQGNIPEMWRLSDSLRDISPLSPEMLFLSGLITLESGNLVDAEKYIRECLDKLPISPVQHFNIQECQVYQALGEIYESKQSWNKAVKFYYNAIKAKPGYLYPLKKLIDLYKRGKPELPIEEMLGFCPPKNKCSLLEKINWQTDEDITLFLILGLTRDIMLCDSYIFQLIKLAVISVFNSKQTENTGYRTTSAMYLARSVMSLANCKYTNTGHITQTCLNLSKNIRDILLL